MVDAGRAAANLARSSLLYALDSGERGILRKETRRILSASRDPEIPRSRVPRCAEFLFAVAPPLTNTKTRQCGKFELYIVQSRALLPLLTTPIRTLQSSARGTDSHTHLESFH